MTAQSRDTAADPRHPLPASDEARRGELPETLVHEKGTGDDEGARVQPAGQPVAPDGESYDAGTGRRSAGGTGGPGVD